MTEGNTTPTKPTETQPRLTVRAERELTSPLGSPRSCGSSAAVTPRISAVAPTPANTPTCPSFDAGAISALAELPMLCAPAEDLLNDGGFLERWKEAQKRKEREKKAAKNDADEDKTKKATTAATTETKGRPSSCQSLLAKRAKRPPPQTAKAKDKDKDGDGDGERPQKQKSADSKQPTATGKDDKKEKELSPEAKAYLLEMQHYKEQDCAMGTDHTRPLVK